MEIMLSSSCSELCPVLLMCEDLLYVPINDSFDMIVSFFSLFSFYRCNKQIRTFTVNMEQDGGRCVCVSMC